MVGRGPRDQSSGEKWCREAREALRRPPPFNLNVPVGRDSGEDGLQRLLLNFRLKPFLGGVLGCVAHSRVVVTLSQKKRRGHLKKIAP